MGKKSHDRTTLKQHVRDFWEKEVCGSRYGKRENSTVLDLKKIAEERYRLEPYISEFVDFKSAKGKHILEIGLDIGADFSRRIKNGAIETGVDLILYPRWLIKRIGDRFGFFLFIEDFKS